jgi:WD40 repeat protein
LACCFSADGKVVATGGIDSTLRLWSVGSGTRYATLAGHGAAICACAFDSDSTALVSGSVDKQLKLWRMDTHACFFTLMGHTACVTSCGFNSNGCLVLSAGSDGTLKLWSAVTGTCMTTLQAEPFTYISACRFGTDGMTAAAVSGCWYNTWNLVKTVFRPEVHIGRTLLQSREDFATVGSFSPSGAQFMAACSDSTLRLWDVASGAYQMTLDGHSSAVRTCVFSPDGAMIASGDISGTLKLWNARSGACLHTMPQLCAGPLSVCAFSPDGRTLLARGTSLQLVSLEAAAP